MLPSLQEKAKGCARGQGRCLWQRAGLSLLSLPPRSDALTAGPPFLLSIAAACFFLLPTHPVYLKKAPGQNRTREREADPAPSPQRWAASFPALRHELLPNYKHLLTSTPISHRPRSSWRGAECCQPSREHRGCRQPPPRRGPRAGTRVRPGARLLSGATQLARLHRAGTSRGFQPPQSSGSKSTLRGHRLQGRSRTPKRWLC